MSLDIPLRKLVLFVRAISIFQGMSELFASAFLPKMEIFCLQIRGKRSMNYEEKSFPFCKFSSILYFVFR